MNDLKSIIYELVVHMNFDKRGLLSSSEVADSVKPVTLTSATTRTDLKKENFQETAIISMDLKE